MKRSVKIYFSLIIMVIFVSGCSKDPLLSGNSSSKITLITQTIAAIGQNSATGGVQVSGGFSDDVLDKGICWSAKSNPTTADMKVSGGSASGSMSLNFSGLTPGTSYYVRGYVVTQNETLYGDEKQFSTLGYQLATLTTTTVREITSTSAVSGGNVTALGGGTVTAKGICWNTVSSPTIFNNKTIDGTGLGAYSSSMSALNPGTVYYVRAYATNQAGTVYGPQASFATVGISLATVSSPVIGSVTQTSALSSASVSASGGGTVTVRGICWSTLTNPTIGNSRTIDGAGLGPYSSVLNNLSPSTTYYVRAYATNQAGTAYGSQYIFTTTVVQLATVSGVTVSGLTKTTATVSGNVTAAGGGVITSRGICYSSTTSNPTVPTNAFTSNGSGTGAISGSLNGLASGTTYYVRAYAVNAAGTSYGALTSFRTL